MWPAAVRGVTSEEIQRCSFRTKGGPFNTSDALGFRSVRGILRNGSENPTDELQTLKSILTQGNNAGGLAITNLANPANAQDAVTKSYVDNLDVSDGDTNSSNEIQTLSQTGGVYTLSLDGGSVTNADPNPANELIITGLLDGVTLKIVDEGGTNEINLSRLEQELILHERYPDDRRRNEHDQPCQLLGARVIDHGRRTWC